MTSKPTLQGPKGAFLFGNLREFDADGLNFLLQQRQYGDLSTFRFGPFPVVLTNSPEYTHQVLVEQADKFYKSALTKRIMGPVVGNGLFTSDGDFWKRQRRLVQPSFHAKRVGSYGEVMVHYANELADNWQDGDLRAVDQDMTTLTMRIIAKVLFDADITHEAPDVGNTIREALAIVEESFRQILLLPDWLPTARNRRMKRVVARLNRLIQGFIDARRASGEDKGDFLSLLLSAQDDDHSTMTDKQVRDEAMTLFGAGHETTSVTLTWAWYLLSQHPAVEARLHAELDSVLNGRLPTVEDLPRLPYTEMIIKETMRLYPAAYIITRQAHDSLMLGDYPIKKDTVVIINAYSIQRDSRYFAEPDRFDPQRFSLENEKAIPKYAYLPFGGGPRVCIGNAFAMMEARLLLATLAQRYSLSLKPGFTVAPDRQFTLRPQYGMQMIAHAGQPVRHAAVEAETVVAG